MVHFWRLNGAKPRANQWGCHVAKAGKGDARAVNVVLGLVSKLFEAAAPIEPVPNLTADDQAILERFLARRMSEETPKP